MRTVNECYFRNVKNVVLGTEKRSAIIFGKAKRPKKMDKKALHIQEYSSSPIE